MGGQPSAETALTHTHTLLHTPTHTYTHLYTLTHTYVHLYWQVKWITLIILLPWHPSGSGIYQVASQESVLEDGVMEAGKISKRKNLSNFDKNQTVTSRCLGQNISKTAGLVMCSRYEVIRRTTTEEQTQVINTEG